MQDLNSFQKWLSGWLLRMRWVRYFIDHVLGAVRFSTKYGRLSGDRFEVLVKYLRPGNTLLYTDHARLTSYFIPGKWSHAAIYAGDGKVVEMVTSGWRTSHLFDLCREADEILVLGTSLSLARAYEAKGIKYDYEFEHGDRELYCSELVAWCDVSRELGDVQDQTLITPSMLEAAARKNNVKVW